MKSSTLKKFFNEFTHNEIALYLLLGIAVVNLLTYLQYNYLGGIVIFSIVALITSHFTKNMVIVLAGTILITNLLISLGFLSNLGVKEGLDNSKPNDKANADTDDDSCTADKDCSNGMHCDMKSKKCVGMTDDDAIDPSTIKVKPKSPTSTPAVPKPPTSTPAVPKPQPTKSGFKNFDDDDEETITISQKSQKHSNAMKDVQNNLQQLLGGDGTQKLDTTELLKQQKQLMEAMQGMQPIIDSANGMINKMGKSPIGKMLGLSPQN
ncbi:hypothetical protein ceV_249 [Chrysochromulina ericina virus CeV-01B]|uniref:Uncharacterized protein n=1 Tax=Chrysochromulina ericina virus CeV-01B TaxID=3070830 RepID=A0A0N9R3G4_9VIRU|nr:hypothetical protein ceV_249 [Chrysochromulina ericina virus]ALH23155.1 hypothetical protein ceV_249 [Chrysochromulina ericina virus CeV-01B]